MACPAGWLPQGSKDVAQVPKARWHFGGSRRPCRFRPLRSATASINAPVNFGRSLTSETTGKLTAIGLALRGGKRRSKQSRSAVTSPAMASSTAFWVRAFAWPSRSCSAAKVALCLAPTGLPRRLPERPGLKRPPLSRACCDPVASGQWEGMTRRYPRNGFLVSVCSDKYTVVERHDEVNVAQGLPARHCDQQKQLAIPIAITDSLFNHHGFTTPDHRARSSASTAPGRTAWTGSGARSGLRPAGSAGCW